MSNPSALAERIEGLKPVAPDLDVEALVIHETGRVQLLVAHVPRAAEVSDLGIPSFTKINCIPGSLPQSQPAP